MSVPVTMFTEGTYPLSTGGVSVWCDQLISGLADFDFHVLALSGITSQVRCTLPANIQKVTVVPLWDRLTEQRCRPARTAIFQEQYATLLTAMLSASPTATADFLSALNDLSEFALQGDLNTVLAEPSNAELLLDLWQVHATGTTEGPRVPPTLPQPSITDALDAQMWLGHLLRPLGHAVPDSRLTHAVSNGLSVLPALATKHLYGIPFLLTEHGIYLRERYLTPPSQYLTSSTRAFLLLFYMHLTRAAYQAADLISPASSFNTRWQLHLGATPEKLRPVYNGIDPDLFVQGASEPPEPTVAWVGRVDPIKDLDTLIRAHALVQHHLPEAHLRMYGPIPQGNEPYEQACRQLIRQLGLANVATFEGRVPFIAQAYHSGHIVALSSISEGFPYTVIEAMATGRPMVATDVGGVREAIGDTGLVVPPRDHRAFAQACEELLRDNHLRHTLGQRARDRVLTLFTVQHCNEAYRAMYQELTNPLQVPLAVGI